MASNNKYSFTTYSFLLLLFLTIILSILSTITPVRAQERVMKEGDNFVIEVQRPTQIDTGITIEGGIKLTPEQLQAAMTGESVPTKVENKEAWGKFYLYREITTITSEEVKLIGKVLTKIEIKNIETKESFNPCFLLGLVCIMLIFTFSRISETILAIITVTVSMIFVAAITSLIITDTIITAFIAMTVIINVTSFGLIALEVDIKRKKFIFHVGTALILLVMGIALFN